MARAKRGFKRRRRLKKIFDRAEGFFLRRKNTYRRMTEAVDRSYLFAYRDRRQKKRDFRRLWISRIAAAANANSISYSRLMAALKEKGVQLDRKMLADIAVRDPHGFATIVEEVRASAPKQ